MPQEPSAPPATRRRVIEKKAPAVAGVPSAERAMQVLTAFRRGDAALSLAQLAERTDLVKSTIMRLAVSLQRFGLLSRLPDGSYRLGAETLRLGTAYQNSFDLADHVLPVLDRLVAATGETASFYVRHGDTRLCLFRTETDNPIRMHVQPGDARPLDDSASGRIFLRAAGGAAPDDLASPLFTAGASDPHAASLAMAVFAANDALAGVLLVSGPVSRLTAARAQEIGPVLVENAAALTRASGGTPPQGKDTAPPLP